MHHRKLAAVIGLLGVYWANLALGLGLGEITLNSALNQPLDAEIRLLQVRDLSAEEINISLAPAEAFREYGVERPFFLQNLEFAVQLDSPSGPIVRITSDQPVREPFLNFLIELQSPSARLLREYTLLMDLPVFSDQQAAPVETVQTQPTPAPQQPVSQPTPRPQSQPVPQPSRATSQPPVEQPQSARTSSPQQRVQPSTRAGVDVYGPVRANETLWEIALAVRPDRSMSVQQTMLALQRLNPEAFINDNINLLRRGQVLRIPDRNDILRLNQREAVAEVAVQNDQWNSLNEQRASGAELTGSRTRTSTRSDDQGVRGQVTLAAPGDAQGSSSRSGSGDAQGEIDRLENELAISMEELDKSERENQELRSRLTDLEEQIETMERLIELNNAEMQQLQQASSQQSSPQQPGQPAADTPVDTAAADAGTDIEPELSAADALDTTGPEAETPPPTDVQASTAPETETPQATTTPPPQSTPPPAQRPTSRSPSIVDLLMDNILYIGVAVILLLIGVFFVIHRRGQASMEAYNQLDEEEFYESDLGEDEAAVAEEDQFAADDDLDLAADLDDDFEEEEPATPTEAETGDAVAEADIYIAYGKYDQAAEMLQKAIIGDPQNIQARLKLLEVYSETKDVDKFDLEYNQLIALGDNDAIGRAAELRSSIPGVGQFEGGQAASPAPSEEALDSGLETGDEFAAGVELDSDFAGSEEPMSADIGDFGELSLDLDDEGAESEGAGIAAASDDRGLDFELDLDADTADESESLADLTAEFAGGEAVSSDDAPSDTIDFSLDLEDDLGGSESGGDDLGGDDDLSGLDLGGDNLGGEVGTDTELSLDLDLDETSLGDDSSALDDEFSIDFETGDEAPSTEAAADDFELETDLVGGEVGGGAVEADDDALADLEFGADDLSFETETEEPELSIAADSGADTGFKEAGSKEEGLDLEDDFDMDMGDLDLAALDQEMDQLVGDLDDIDDGEEEVAAPTEVMTALDDDFNVDDLSDLGDSATPATDDSDLSDLEFDVQSEDEFGDDLTFGSGAASAAEDDEGGGIGEDMNAELDFLADTDEVATKLDLARAYIDMGDKEGAKDILDEVSAEGNAEQKQEAATLMSKI